MSEATWPYDLPIWRRHFRAVSPDGKLVAQIDPAYEVSMGNPTSGMLCVSSGLHVARCNPSFIWSDDSAYLAVPQYFEKLRVFRRQRVLVIAFAERRVYASAAAACYFQPDSFIGGRLVVSINPAREKRKLTFQIPDGLPSAFSRNVWVPWPEMPRSAEAGSSPVATDPGA